MSKCKCLRCSFCGGELYYNREDDILCKDCENTWFNREDDILCKDCENTWFNRYDGHSDEEDEG